MERPIHDSIGALVIVLALGLLLAASGALPESDVPTCWENHSGVEECYAPLPDWTPTDTTGGADIIL